MFICLYSRYHADITLQYEVVKQDYLLHLTLNNFLYFQSAMAKDPGQDPSFQRYKTAILDCISRHSTPDLQVKCADGDMKVAGLVVAAVCPAFRGLEGRQLEDCCLVLPDVTTETLSLFLSVLCHADSHKISVEEIRVIKKIANLLGCSVDLSQCPASTSSPPQHPPQDRDSPEHSSQETESLSQDPESPSPDPGGRGNKTKVRRPGSRALERLSHFSFR